MARYAVIDLEATGISSGHVGHIIQIGITFIENNRIEDTLTIDVRPPQPIEAHITELTGITNEQVEEAPLFSDIATYLKMILEGCFFVAHNLHFDYTLLREEFLRAGFSDFSMTGLDTIEIAKILYPQEETYGLQHLTSKRGIINEQEHHAGSDAKATAKLFLHMLEDASRLHFVVLDTIKEVLLAKSDFLLHFFEAALPKNISLDLVPDDSEPTLVLEEPKKGRPDPILAGLQSEKPLWISDPLLQNQLLDTIQTSGQKVLFILNNEQIRHQKEKDYPFFETYKYQDAFINVQQVMWYLRHPELLNRQEARQLCAIQVWLHMTKTGDIDELNEQCQLRKRLSRNSWQDQNNYYQKQFAKIQASPYLLMTQRDFVLGCTDLEKQLNLEDYILLIDQGHALNETITSVFSQTLALSHYRNMAKQLKMHLQTNHPDDTSALRAQIQLDHVLAELDWFLQTCQKTFPDGFLGESEMVENDYKVFFMAKLDDLDKAILLRVKTALEIFVGVLRVYPNTFHKLYMVLLDLIEDLGHMIETNEVDDYISVSLKRLAYSHHYIFHFHKYTAAKWLTQHVYQKGLKRLYFGVYPFGQLGQTYLQTTLGESKIQVLGEREMNCKITVPEEWVSSHVMKENLLLKKAEKLARDLADKKVACIFPNQVFMERFRETGLGEQMSKRTWQQMQETSSFLYGTWQQFQDSFPPESQLDILIVLRLPFESPDSIVAQVSKHFLLGKQQTYFKNIALPKMIFKLLRLCQQIEGRVSKLLILDKRVIESGYAEDILEGLGPKTHIIQEKLAIIPKEW